MRVYYYTSTKDERAKIDIALFGNAVVFLIINIYLFIHKGTNGEINYETVKIDLNITFIYFLIKSIYLFSKCDLSFHENLHAMKADCYGFNSIISYQRKCCLIFEQMNRSQFIIIALTPLFIIGIIPFVMINIIYYDFTVLRTISFLYLTYITSSCSGDINMTLKSLRHTVNAKFAVNEKGKFRVYE